MRLLRKIAMKLMGQYYSSDEMVEKLRSGGATIGQNVKIYAPNKVRIDATAPYLLKIGDHVRICENVTILTHDYSWSVLKYHCPIDGMAGAVLGAQSPVVIGSHVFIGMNATIMRGVTIGDNVIIGASSVVLKDCESGWVYAGNPAKKIMSIEDYYAKRREKQFEEAKTCYETLLDDSIQLLDMHKMELQCEVLFFELINMRSEDVIKELYTRKMKSYIKMMSSVYINKKRLQYAICLYERKKGWENELEKIYEEALKIRDTYPVKAEVEGEMEVFDFLRAPKQIFAEWEENSF